MTQSAAALWVDGRYHLQADVQTDDNWLVMKQGTQIMSHRDVGYMILLNVLIAMYTIVFADFSI